MNKVDDKFEKFLMDKAKMKNQNFIFQSPLIEE